MCKKISLLVVIVFFLFKLQAEEGMWLPLLLEKYNIEIMQSKGFKLDAEDVYSVNKACMKDAVVRLGNGCTGEIVSDKGLVLTNHHCGLRYVQSHSCVENDYLRDGFWAMSMEEEKPNPGMSVLILKRMEDVSNVILEAVENVKNEEERMDIIDALKLKLEHEAVNGTHYEANVESFYYGNQYYLFVMERFKDVRLVGAPPSGIGNFGGDTDNWTWPRHTGDFSVFRIYADENNNPKSYSDENVPYKPKKYFPVSLKGVKEDDFTMVFGYPGSTNQYLPSYALEMFTEVRYPARIGIRDKKLEIINAAIESDPELRIQYTAKTKWISNSWKRWKGEINGLEKLRALEKKRKLENEFNDWVRSDSELQKKYGNLLSTFKMTYENLEKYGKIDDYYYELTKQGGVEILGLLTELDEYIFLWQENKEDETIIEKMRLEVDEFFKDYNYDVGIRLSESVLKKFIEDVSEDFLPEEFMKIKEKYGNDIGSYVERIFSKSFLANKSEVDDWLNHLQKNGIKRLINDPLYVLYESINQAQMTKVSPRLNELNHNISSQMRIYVKALMEMQKEKVFYPDANSTLRVSYGQVKGYFPEDGVYYNYSSTLKGIIEKDNPEIYDYDVPQKLKDLFIAKDYGRYGEDGRMNVCFTATNHTTGGNSGSPVLNANGELIGINFDRAWEGVMSDMMYSPEQSRNISVDIRYVLFIIDKYAGAGYLLDEMTLVE